MRVKRKIKMINLLNKIADNKNIPPLIRYNYDFYNYDTETQNYIRSLGVYIDFLIGEDITALLNDEVEIIDWDG